MPFIERGNGVNSLRETKENCNSCAGQGTASQLKSLKKQTWKKSKVIHSFFFWLKTIFAIIWYGISIKVSFMIMSGRVGYLTRSPVHEGKNVLNVEEPEQKNSIESTRFFTYIWCFKLFTVVAFFQFHLLLYVLSFYYTSSML